MAAGFDNDMFDPEDKNCWYFGQLTREETNNILLRARDSGVFLVRDSSSIKGDFVLCVREDSKVSHYIINKIQVGGDIRFRIGDQEFPDLASLLTFYKTHYLDTTSLIRPAPRLKVRGKFDFAGSDADDLPFKKGEILTILFRDEEQWWTALNSQGKTGQIPVPYVETYDPEQEQFNQHQQATSQQHRQQQEQAKQNEKPAYQDPIHLVNPPVTQINGQQRKLPALARVVQQRVPNAYDRTALRLEVGDEVLVTFMHINGQWEGEINGKNGFFPFTHVKFIDLDDPEVEDD